MRTTYARIGGNDVFDLPVTLKPPVIPTYVRFGQCLAMGTGRRHTLHGYSIGGVNRSLTTLSNKTLKRLSTGIYGGAIEESYVGRVRRPHSGGMSTRFITGGRTTGIP